MKIRSLSWLALGALVGCEPVNYDKDLPTTTSPSTGDRTNTSVNSRDADNRTVTPFDQSNNQSDIDLVARIRKQVLEIDDLSVNGRNIKIITNDGKVVLRGPVTTEEERSSIIRVANEIAGEANVTSELEVSR